MSIGVNSVDPYANNGNASPVKKNDELGKDDFLKMFIAQLKNQDPLNPMDGMQFTAQLAQFSSLEQLTNVNSQLGNLKTTQEISNNSLAVSYIGKRIKAKGNSIYYDGNKPVEIGFKLNGNAADFKAFIYDQKDHLVRVIEKTDLYSGDQTVVWDGKGENGENLPAGNYTFDVMATDINGNTVDSTTYTCGEVTGITYENNSAYLLLGDELIAPADVKEVMASKS